MFFSTYRNLFHIECYLHFDLSLICLRFTFVSGFTHSAFALGYEAGINKSHIDGNLVPPGALVTFVQKGLQYIELEANLDGVSAHVSYY